MNEFSELEKELRRQRPTQPSPLLFQRVEEALENFRAPVSEASRKRWRFIEWLRRGASGTDGQLVRAREGERTSQTAYRNWWSVGFGFGAAAVLILFAALTMERRHERQEI